MTWPAVQIHEPLSTARAHLIQSTDDAAELLRWLSTKTEIAMDVESTGLDHDTDRCRLVQIGDSMDGWAIPFERWAGLVDDIVVRFQGWYTYHNFTFDLAMLHNGGIEIPLHRVKDTRIMAHVLTSTGPLALKTLAQKHVDPMAAAAQQDLEEALGRNGAWTWATVPVNLQAYWLYASLDTILTSRLREILEPRVMAEAPLSYQLEMQAAVVCEKMARNGAHVDREYTQQLADEMSSYVQQVNEWCQTAYGFSPGSTDGVVNALLRDGVMLTKRTDGGKLSIDKEVLGNIDHPLAQAVLSRRQAEKLSSTYLETYLRESARDGRIHPSINSIGGMAKNPFESGGTRGVRTGRSSMSGVNLQNVPVRTKEGKRIRNCFDAQCSDRMCGCGNPHKWIKCDFDQIEMRIFAHLANDPGLISAFRRSAEGGDDFFLAIAKDMFNDSTIVKDDQRRQHVKNANYAIIYSAGLEQFARTAGIMHDVNELVSDSSGNQVWVRSRQPDTAVANAFLQRLHAAYPGIKQLQNRIGIEARQTREATGEAFVRSPLTNRKHVADPGRDYALLNYDVQGMAGEILKMKMIEADQAGLGQFMILPVHDEIDMDVPAADVDAVATTLRDIMNDFDMLSVPITSTMSIGDRWGSVVDV